ncbi:hypothetical protein CUJ83_14865 [Methanocella sp. CWC-04]|uniref:Uncharacterized protein n=1 Tax=Methanooceanicella nereidis TaxID=2052831 RepID=A0AAP2RHF4_9EURY|nr:hypothetical protein [Methanocella sp. CWC-04]MCD1296282.1 hypothetical protein [Methanocella sp. CWC-04]
MNKDDSGWDLGVITGLGITVASAVLLLAAFCIFKGTAPSDTTIALHSTVCEITGDIDMAYSLTIPYTYERSYDLDNVDVMIASDHIIAMGAGCKTFVKPLTARVYPAKCIEEQHVLWNDTAGMREYLNRTYGATGTDELPLDDHSFKKFRGIMEKAAESMIMDPLKISGKDGLTIEKTFIHVRDPGQNIRREGFVFISTR